PVGLHQPDRLLGGALLVGAHRESQVPGLDRLLVLGEGDLAAGERHPLDADQDVHELISARRRLMTGPAHCRGRTPASSRWWRRSPGSARPCTGPGAWL